MDVKSKKYKHWDIYAWFYASKLYDVNRLMIDEILSSIDSFDGKLIDNIGCCTAYLEQQFPNRCTVRSFDISHKALEKAHKKEFNCNINFHLADFYSDDFTRFSNDYTPDILFTNRVLYLDTLENNITRIFNHSNDSTEIIITHPSPNPIEFIGTGNNLAGKLVQISKLSNRLMANILNKEYNLYTKEEWQECAKQLFNNVKVSSIGYGTHYMIQCQGKK